MSCENCARLNSEISRLKEENSKLRYLLACAKKVISQQKNQLDAVRVESWNWICQARKAMAAGNLPRATWALWKGRGEVAGRIYKIVWVDWGTEILNAIASLGI